MTKKNRIIASVLALTVAFAVLFSVGFIIAEADHDCIGDGCSVCFCIGVCENTIKSVGFVGAAAVFSAFLRFFIFCPIDFKEKSAGNISLVSLKVKLSD